MSRIGLFTVAVLCLAGCEANSSNPRVLTLNQANSNPVQYRDKLVKVCGMATRQFENVQITEHREGEWRDTSAGLGVHWLESEPRTREPEHRCVTGKLQPLGGWDFYEKQLAGETDEIVVSTGHSYKWVIVQKTLSRD